MDSVEEKDIKDRLTEVWKKEMIRVQNIPNGWIEKRITLGRGILKNQGIAKVDEMLDTIKDFGIGLDDLGSMNPDYDQINDIYQAILSYRIAVRLLKRLKEHMETFQNLKDWRNN